MATFANSGLLGVDTTAVASTPAFKVGTTALLSDGGIVRYVQALSEISTFAAVAIYVDNTVQMLTTTNGATTPAVGFAQTSIASAWYGWVAESGPSIKVNLAANCDDNVPLFTTATGGVLDDATVTAGYIMGLTNTVTISNATAVTCIASFPHIGRYGGGA